MIHGKRTTTVLIDDRELVNMEPFNQLTLSESRLMASRTRLAIILIFLGAGLLLLFFNRFSPNRPTEYANDREHFLYGSIGSDISGGLPVKVMLVLPRMFPEYLPPGYRSPDYSAFGFLQEKGHAMPIGFSTRRQFIDLTSINCAVCHTGSVREGTGSDPMLIAGMPANTVDLLGFFQFLFRCAADDRFNSREVLAQMSQAGLLETGDSLIYRLVIPRMKAALLEKAQKLSFTTASNYTPYGPGRVDTFDTFKFDQFAPYYQTHQEAIGHDEIYGIVDFPSIWNQRARDGMYLHWDGNNPSLRERNFSAAIGAGANPEDMEVQSLYRVEAWLKDLPAPGYPFNIDEMKARRGAAVYDTTCYACHDLKGTQVGSIFSLATTDLGTDRSRVDSYTEFLKAAQQNFTQGYFWSFTHFRKTDGYSAPPLDGVWARAPYLHNGSVPNLRMLLERQEKRPAVFTIGSDIYDQFNMGFEHLVLIGSREQGYRRQDGAPFSGPGFVYDTRLRGNSNQGHSGAKYGTELTADEKSALIEFFKWQEVGYRGK